MSEGMHGFKDEQLSVLATWNLIEQFSPEPIPEPTGRKRRSRRNGRRRQGEDWRAQLELPSSALGETPDDAAEDADLPVRFHRYQGTEARRGKGRNGGQAPLPDYQVLDLRPGMMLPWQEIADADAFEGQWRHTVYLGCFTAENIARELESIFVDSTDNLAVARGMSACATVQLDSLGRVLPETAVLSSAAWGVGRARDPGPIVPWWFLGFDAGSKELVNSIRTFEARRSSDGHPSPQTSDSLAELVAIAQSAAGVTRIPSLARPAVRIKSVRVREPGAPGAHGLPPDVGEEDSLNSPFLDEIALASDLIRRDDAGMALSRFLSPDRAVNTARRHDMRKRSAAIDARLSASRIPAGRWPADPALHLSRNQQFAVNRAMHELSDRGGILAINGAPGTGKAAVVREILAGNVVERARRLSRLRDPRDAFTGAIHTWEDGASRREVPQLKPELTGFETVVVSAGPTDTLAEEFLSPSFVAKKWRSGDAFFKGLAAYVNRGRVAAASRPEGRPVTAGSGRKASADAPASAQSRNSLFAGLPMNDSLLIDSTALSNAGFPLPSVSSEDAGGSLPPIDIASFAPKQAPGGASLLSNAKLAVKQSAFHMGKTDSSSAETSSDPAFSFASAAASSAGSRLSGASAIAASANPAGFGFPTAAGASTDAAAPEVSALPTETDGPAETDTPMGDTPTNENATADAAQIGATVDATEVESAPSADSATSTAPGSNAPYSPTQEPASAEADPAGNPAAAGLDVPAASAPPSDSALSAASAAPAPSSDSPNQGSLPGVASAQSAASPSPAASAQSSASALSAPSAQSAASALSAASPLSAPSAQSAASAFSAPSASSPDSPAVLGLGEESGAPAAGDRESAAASPSADRPSDREAPAPGAWAMVAAQLDTKAQQAAFRRDYWFADGAAGVAGMNAILEEQTIRRDNLRLADWANACAAYAEVEKKVEALLRQRVDAERRRDTLAQLPTRLARAEDAVYVAVAELREAEASVPELIDAAASSERELRAASALVQSQRQEEPGLFRRIGSGGGAKRDWQARYDELSAREAAAAEADGLARAALAQAEELVRARAHRVSAIQQELIQIRADIPRLTRQCEEDRRLWGKSYPGAPQSEAEQEQNTPWLDVELDEARSELFLAALKLHAAFLRAAAEFTHPGLDAATDVVAGNCPHNLEPEKLTAAWQLLFLAVPLVCTTFTAAARMFHSIGREAFGWLAVDEAAEVRPQMAVGTLARARRTIAIGDPLRLEPTVAVPMKTSMSIASMYGTAQWLAPGASVQTLADRVSSYGTTLRTGERADGEPSAGLWVGIPLRVQSHCSEPMHSILNAIAYDGSLFAGAGGSPTSIPQSAWIDIPADNPGSHVQPLEIDAVRKILDKLRPEGVSADRIFIVTPFAQVARELEMLSSIHWPGLRTGTIQRMPRGRSEVVILVLGGDPDRAAAKVRVTKNPNLITAAVGRAKDRLYVIGDRSAWSQYPYLDVVSDLLG